MAGTHGYLYQFVSVSFVSAFSTQVPSPHLLFSGISWVFLPLPPVTSLLRDKQIQHTYLRENKGVFKSVLPTQLGLVSASAKIPAQLAKMCEALLAISRGISASHRSQSELGHIRALCSGQ